MPLPTENIASSAQLKVLSPTPQHIVSASLYHWSQVGADLLCLHPLLLPSKKQWIMLLATFFLSLLHF